MDRFELVREEFLSEGAARGLSANTVRMYRDALKTFETWAATSGLSGVSEVTVSHLRAFMAQSLTEISPGGVHARMRPLRTFLRWCVQEEILGVDPTKRLRLPKVPDPDVKVVRPVDFKRLLARSKLGAKPLRDSALLHVLFDTGLRASEVCALRVSDVDPSGFLRVRHGKGGRSRSVPMGRSTVKVIRSYLLQEREETTLEALFLISEEEGLNTNALGKMLYRLCKNAGTPNFSPHAFRRGMAVEFMRQGGDQFALQRILGHTSLKMTGVYAKLESGDLKDIHRRASPVLSALGE